MLGRDRTRNPVSPEKGAPLEWDVATGRNIKWRAKIGGNIVASPVVAKGRVWIGSSMDSPLPDGGMRESPVLKCLRESDGQILWQCIMLPTNGMPQAHGWMSYHSSPLIEGDRFWMTTRYAQVHCLKIGPSLGGIVEPALQWTLDMGTALDVHPFYSVMCSGQTCSIGASYRDRIYVLTGNGIWGSQAEKQMERFYQVHSPLAPSLVCVDRNSGKMRWQDHSPGTNIFWGSWGSPLAAEIGGRAQVVAPMGDGWVRSFDALTGELLWKLNINSNSITNRHQRNHFLNAPVLYEDRIYIGGGFDRDGGEGLGRLYCIDPSRRGDLSLELADGSGKVKANSNTGVVWHFDALGRTTSQPAIQDGLLIAVGFNGLVHCLDARTGHPYWQHDTKAFVMGSPLLVERRIYVINEDGDVHILELARQKSLIATRPMDSPSWSAPIFANGVLYVVAGDTLYAIQHETHSLPNP